MSDFDLVLERLVSEPAFRAALAADPAGVLAGYSLAPDEVELLHAQAGVDPGGQRGVEQRTSKAGLFGLASSLSGIGQAGGGGPATGSGAVGQPLAHGGIGPAAGHGGIGQPAGGGPATGSGAVGQPVGHGGIGPAAGHSGVWPAAGYGGVGPAAGYGGGGPADAGGPPGGGAVGQVSDALDRAVHGESAAGNPPHGGPVTGTVYRSTGLGSALQADSPTPAGGGHGAVGGALGDHPPVGGRLGDPVGGRLDDAAPVGPDQTALGGAGLGEQVRDYVPRHGGQPADGYRTRVDVDGDRDWDAFTATRDGQGGVILRADADGDGRTDFVGYDANSDGLVDGAAYDNDRDGRFETHLVDSNGDGWLDRPAARPGQDAGSSGRGPGPSNGESSSGAPAGA